MKDYSTIIIIVVSFITSAFITVMRRVYVDAKKKRLGFRNKWNIQELGAICYAKHKKTGNMYTVYSMRTVNKTDPQDGQYMFLYVPQKDSNGHFYVREAKEFLQKFDVIQI